MPHRCVFSNCNNEPVPNQITILAFPKKDKEPKRYSEWVKFVNLRRDSGGPEITQTKLRIKPWKPNDDPHICSLHFLNTDFYEHSMDRFRRGEIRHLRLKANTVPSLISQRSNPAVVSEGSRSGHQRISAPINIDEGPAEVAAVAQAEYQIKSKILFNTTRNTYEYIQYGERYVPWQKYYIA